MKDKRTEQRDRDKRELERWRIERKAEKAKRIAKGRLHAQEILKSL